VMEYISIDRQIAQPPADTMYVSVAAYVKAMGAKTAMDAGKITPPQLAQMLEQDSRKALKLTEPIRVGKNTAFRQEVADIQAWANLGLYFAEKLRGGVALATYRQAGGEANKQQAIDHLEKALGYWDEVVRITRPIYADMPLAAYSYPADGKRVLVDTKRYFHWEKLRPDVARDVEIARKATVGSPK